MFTLSNGRQSDSLIKTNRIFMAVINVKDFLSKIIANGCLTCKQRPRLPFYS